MAYLWFLLVLIVNVQIGLSDDGFVTQTVYGFLDFTTTIENTVMVFSPQSAPVLDIKGESSVPSDTIETKPVTTSNPFGDGIKPTKSTIDNQSAIESKQLEKTTQKILSSQVVISTESNVSPKATVQKSTHEDSKESALQVENSIDQPEYDLLSRQPAEYAEETYRVVNLKSRIRDNNRVRNTASKISADSAVTSSRPVGLVTKLSASEAKNGVTTYYETSVIGTYISGKYAQVLQSSSDVFRNDRPRVQPTQSLRVLKTAAPSIPKAHTSSKPAYQTGHLNRKRTKISSSTENRSIETTTAKEILSERTHSKKSSGRNKSKRRHKSSRPSAKKTNYPTTSPTTSTAALTPESHNRRSFRPKIHASTVESESTSLYTFKLNRTPGRWQYKTSPKPRVNIRKPVNDSVTVVSPAGNINESAAQNLISYQGDLEPSGSQNGAIVNNVDQENSRKIFVETLNVEISTPANGGETYYEIATIKTPYTFQAGVLKKTRYITVTSTFEKIFPPDPTATLADGEPLTQNILTESANTPAPDSSLIDSSIVTLQPIYLANSVETPVLETVTESFSVTHTKLKTQILPVVREDENTTSYLTLVQTYDYTNLITVTKTVSPLDENQFVPSLNFKDFGGNLDEAGSELNLELEYGDEDNAEVLNNEKPHGDTDARIATINASLDKTKNIQTAPINSNLNPDQIKQLALLNLFNPSAQLSTVITSTRPFIKQETLWESHVVPIVNGLSTVYRTLSKSVGTVDKTEYRLETATVQLPPQVTPPPISVNPYLLPLQQFQTITSPVVLQTTAVHTNSKVLKLTFGARTAYTTIYSTEVTPTALTTFITTSLPVQPTAAFPGYFPPPYPPFPYLG